METWTSFLIRNEPGRIAGPDGSVQSSSQSEPVPPNCHWRVRLIHDYWRLKQAERLRHADGGGLPAYQEFDLREVSGLVPYIWLIDVAPGPMRFRFHSVGEVIAKWAGEDNSGRWFDEIWPTYDPVVFIEVVKSRQPSWCRGPSTFRPARREYEIERVRLPLASDGTKVDMILALSVFYDREGREILPGENKWSILPC
jgi:hypothetical protein